MKTITLLQFVTISTVKSDKIKLEIAVFFIIRSLDKEEKIADWMCGEDKGRGG